MAKPSTRPQSSRLGIALFGRLRLTLDGKPFRMALRPKATELFLFLLLHRAAPVLRDALAFRLWPDEPEESARSNLRRHLYIVRQALPASNKPWIAIHGDSVQWNPPGDVSLDVSEFERLCKLGDPRAIELYTADLLEDSYDDWILPHRERLGSLYLHTLWNLATKAQEGRDLTTAEALLQRMLRADPMREDALRAFMSVRYGRGDRAGALAAFDEFEQRVAREFGATPMQQTLALRDQIAHDSEAPAGAVPLDVVDAAEFRTVPCFSGRDEELAALQAVLASEGAIAVVHGMAGVGKSSVAREFGRRNRDRYAVVWWLNAQTEAGIIEGLLRLGATITQRLEEPSDHRAAALRVVNSLLSGLEKPALLVFDNLEDERLLRSWLPPKAQALATSRDAAWSADIGAVPLAPWSLETAIEYLRNASGRADMPEAEARAIAQSLGALPLALAHAAAVLRGMRMVSPARYLERLNEHLTRVPRGAEYQRSVAATLSASIEQAEEQAPGAAALLCFAACFAPDAIPEELFRVQSDLCPGGFVPVAHTGTPLDLRSALSSDLNRDLALSALDRLGLVSFVPSARAYSIHRLVQLAARRTFHKAVAWAEFSVEAAAAAFPVGEPTLAQIERLLPHAMAALAALPHDSRQLAAATLALQCARYHWERGEFALAEQLCQRALAIQQRSLGPDHPDVATTLNNLANAYAIQGRYAEAERVFAGVLDLREKTLGSDDLNVAIILNNLAIVYVEQGRYSEAEPLHRRALAIRELSLGPDHPDVSESLNNLGALYWLQGSYADAEPFHLRALAIREKTFGAIHRDVASSLSNLGNVCSDSGRYYEAEPLHVRALAIDEELLGPGHPDVGECLNNLAVLYRRQGRYADAEPMQTRALAVREKALGPNHPDVAQSLADLAELYREQGQAVRAGPLLIRALAIWEKALGPDHPSTKARAATWLPQPEPSHSTNSSRKG